MPNVSVFYNFITVTRVLLIRPTLSICKARDIYVSSITFLREIFFSPCETMQPSSNKFANSLYSPSRIKNYRQNRSIYVNNLTFFFFYIFYNPNYRKVRSETLPTTAVFGIKTKSRFYSQR